MTNEKCLFTRLCGNVSTVHKYWYRIIILRSAIYILQAARTCHWVLYAKPIPTDDISETRILNYSVCTKAHKFNTVSFGLIKKTFGILTSPDIRKFAYTHSLHKKQPFRVVLDVQCGNAAILRVSSINADSYLLSPLLNATYNSNGGNQSDLCNFHLYHPEGMT